MISNPNRGQKARRICWARYGMNLLCVRYRHDEDQRE